MALVILMVLAECHCRSLSLSEDLFYLFSRARPRIVEVFLHTSVSHLLLSPNDTSDSSVVRDGVVWHVKGRLPFRGTMAVQYGGPLVADTRFIARVS